MVAAAAAVGPCHRASSVFNPDPGWGREWVGPTPGPYFPPQIASHGGSTQCFWQETEAHGGSGRGGHGRGRVVARTKAEVSSMGKAWHRRPLDAPPLLPHAHPGEGGRHTIAQHVGSQGGVKAEGPERTGPGHQSKPCQSLCSESYSSSAPTHLTPSSSMGVPWCRSMTRACTVTRT